MSASKPHPRDQDVRLLEDALAAGKDVCARVSEGPYSNEWLDALAALDRIVAGSRSLEEQLEAVQRERDTLEDAIAAYAEASGVLVHSWPDDERERRRVALYSDTKFMRSALDEQADAIETLRTERDWWREQAVRGLEAGEVARLDYEALEASTPASSLPEYVELEGTLADGLDEESNQDSVPKEE